MIERPSEAEARAIVIEELRREGWDTASTFTVENGLRPGAHLLSWWHENTPGNERSETKRSIAYLRAYIRIAGPKLYAGGLFMKRKRLWMDRSIISRLEHDGYLRFEGADSREPFFVLTESGEAMISANPGPD